jgi:broad specificity phosphatase PhoE
MDEAVLIISHGFEMRVTLKSLLGWTEDYFESLAHPQHCEIKRLAFDRGSFVLLDEMVKYDHSRNPDFIRRQPAI